MEIKNYKIEIPQYLSIARYQQLQNIEHLSELGKLIKTLHVFTGISEDEIMTWEVADLGRVAKDFSKKGISGKALHNVQLMQNKVDNAFKWYTLKEYNNDERYVDAEIMKELPAGFALGALSFFLGTASLLSISSMTYLDQIPNRKELMKKMKRETLEALTGIGDGLRHYTRLPKQVFSISQEKLVSLN